MRANSPGFSVPEERLTPQPFYYNMPPPIYRWNELNWRYDAYQRWFYTCFTGRTQESIWLTECMRQIDGTANAISQVGDYSDPLNWTMPAFVNSVASVAGHPIAYSNYIMLGENVRPENLKTKRAAQTAVDELYIASRHSFPRAAFRIDMYLPSAAEIAARSVVTDTTNFFVGFEVNSQGGQAIYCLRLYADGANVVYRLEAIGLGADGVTWTILSDPITMHHPGAWSNYYFEWDPPVFRFIQDPFSTPEVWELSIPTMAAVPHVQPFIANESLVATNAIAALPLTWNINQWSIWPLHVGGNVYKVNRRDCAVTACSPYSAIFDTGGRSFLHLNLKTIGCGCTYYIYHTEVGEDNRAAEPELRKWRRIGDSDWTGTTSATTGETGIGLFNAARWICAVLAGTYPASNADYEEICFTSNGGGQI